MTKDCDKGLECQELGPAFTVGNKSTVSPALKGILKHPPHVLASEEELAYCKNLFDPWFEVGVYFGPCSLPQSHFPYGVFVATIRAKGKDRVVGKPVSFLLHDVEENFGDEFSRIRAELAPFAKTTCREVLDAVISYVLEMRKRGAYEEVDEAKMNELLSDSPGVGEALRWFQMLETAMVNEPEAFASLERKNYDRKKHYGVLLDTPKAKKKFGEFAIGVHRRLLLSLFCDIEVDDEDTNGLKASNEFLNKVISSWRQAGILFKRTEYSRGNEKITGLNENDDYDRFYVISSQKICDAWAEYMKEVENKNA